MKNLKYLFLFILVLFANSFPQHVAVKTAARFNSFKQIAPDILGMPTVKTEAYFLYDNENIYYTHYL